MKWHESLMWAAIAVFCTPFGWVGMFMLSLLLHGSQP